jgi:hypothetical protein
VQFGGPVQTGRGFVLHSADYSGGDSTVKIGQASGLQLGLTATVDVVKAIADGRGPKASMLALGTPEWQKKETTWKKAFTFNIVKSGFALKTYEIREPEIEGDKATVSVRAIFDESGKDNREGMRFTLERRDGRWWITELH